MTNQQTALEKFYGLGMPRQSSISTSGPYLQLAGSETVEGTQTSEPNLGSTSAKKQTFKTTNNSKVTDQITPETAYDQLNMLDPNYVSTQNNFYIRQYAHPFAIPKHRTKSSQMTLSIENY